MYWLELAIYDKNMKDKILDCVNYIKYIST